MMNLAGVPVVPVTRWKEQQSGGSFPLSPRLRNFQPTRQRPHVRLTIKGRPRTRLLWSAEVAPGFIVAAFTAYELDRYDGDVLIIDQGKLRVRCRLPEDFNKSVSWNRARLIETAKAAVATLRERHAPVPTVSADTFAWLTRALSELDLLKPNDWPSNDVNDDERRN